MPEPPPGAAPAAADTDAEIAEALVALRRGAPEGMDRLLPVVYEELRRVAHRQLGVEREGHTLGTTGLVHETYLRLAAQSRTPWVDRAHFFAVAARIMRRVLVDYARRHRAARRGAGRRAVTLDDADAAGALVAAGRADELLALDEALARLGEHDERLARVVECRYFAGLTEAETADALGVSQRTVARDWLFARGWLLRALRDGDG